MANFVLCNICNGNQVKCFIESKFFYTKQVLLYQKKACFISFYFVYIIGPYALACKWPMICGILTVEFFNFPLKLYCVL